MTAIFIILTVILAFSLYDHFNSRNWQQITSSQRNETVFAERNRNYGAYTMRRDYNRRLLVIIFGFSLGTGLLYATTFLRETATADAAIEIPEDVFIMPLPAREDLSEEDLPQVQQQEEQQSLQNITAFNEPVVRDDAREGDINIPDEGDRIGNEDQAGDDEDDFVNPVIVIKKKKEERIIEVTDDNEIREVDEPAQFPGGYDALRAYLGKNIRYPSLPYELGIQGKCYIRFVVSKKGDISDVTIMRGVPDCNECDQEAVRVVKGMPDWKPGKSNGKIVNSYFNLPVNFVIKN